MAGGCASIATSFIFTPSERIKQQMQVGSHYHSCWYVFKILVLSVAYITIDIVFSQVFVAIYFDCCIHSDFYFKVFELLFVIVL